MGEPRGGYLFGDTATIAETTTVPDTCTVDSRKVTSANGEPVDEVLPYAARLTRAENTFTVRNTVSCEHKGDTWLTLVKHVVNKHGGSAEPGDWTLTADGPKSLSGTSGSAGVTHVPVPPGTYTLGEANGPAGYRAVGWTCTDSEGQDAGAVEGEVTLTTGDDTTCTLTNTSRGSSPSPHPSHTWPGPGHTTPPGGGHGGGSGGGDHGGGGELSHTGAGDSGPLALTAPACAFAGSILLFSLARRRRRAY
ncbi:hypothetical protein ACIQZB_43720 [Streptomyces sp. NPDC097727]|uniref:prealbumin-like fold domain-containing protein n=1 Tax=Streptomyces sp. NPDC097727 TaxID=3366092 RepID=UPI00382CDE11